MLWIETGGGRGGGATLAWILVWPIYPNHMRSCCDSPRISYCDNHHCDNHQDFFNRIIRKLNILIIRIIVLAQHDKIYNDKTSESFSWINMRRKEYHVFNRYQEIFQKSKQQSQIIMKILDLFIKWNGKTRSSCCDNH